MTYKELGEALAKLNDVDAQRQAMVVLPDGATHLHVKDLEVVREDVRLNPVVILTTERSEHS